MPSIDEFVWLWRTIFKPKECGSHAYTITIFWLIFLGEEKKWKLSIFWKLKKNILLEYVFSNLVSIFALSSKIYLSLSYYFIASSG